MFEFRLNAVYWKVDSVSRVLFQSSIEFTFFYIMYVFIFSVSTSKNFLFEKNKNSTNDYKIKISSPIFWNKKFTVEK